MPQFGPKLSAAGRRRLNVRLNTDPVFAAVSDGLFAVAMRIGEVAAAAAPDAPTYVIGKKPDSHRVPQPSEGFGLQHNWGAMSWSLGKLMQAHGATSGEKVSKPRGMGPVSKTGAEAVVGFGFPGRLNELGKVNQPARPFFGPAALSVVTSPEFKQILAEHFPKGPKA